MEAAAARVVTPVTAGMAGMAQVLMEPQVQVAVQEAVREVMGAILERGVV